MTALIQRLRKVSFIGPDGVVAEDGPFTLLIQASQHVERIVRKEASVVEGIGKHLCHSRCAHLFRGVVLIPSGGQECVRGWHTDQNSCSPARLRACGRYICMRVLSTLANVSTSVLQPAAASTVFEVL